MNPTDEGQPLGDASADPLKTDERRRWWLLLAGVVVVGIAVVAALVWGGDDDGQNGAPAGTSTTTSASTSTTATTEPEGSTTTSSSTTTTTQGPVVPAAVAGVSAGPGGGSGEVALRWDAVAGVTGYRVLRSEAASGPFETVADLNITTGQTTAAPEAVNIWSEEHSYLPATGTLAAPDPSPWFEYVEVGGPDPRCFRVVAYNAAGDGPASAISCGSPP